MVEGFPNFNGYMRMRYVDVDKIIHKEALCWMNLRRVRRKIPSKVSSNWHQRNVSALANGDNHVKSTEQYNVILKMRGGR